ncbi:MAG: cation diffusion facilitator family transporter [Leptospiraceae bacterium]|nr:cation diffusion facilitator family transporter [Leptospiraceae bacterium]MDW8307363.1 cation diffusion facilitator family transporter [Leptospiraceae bacterium]
MGSEASSLKAILYAFLANFGIGLSKVVAAVITGSQAMVAEAIHSFADSLNQVLLVVGLKRSERPADEEHPLGYGKAIYFWSFLVALLLFSMGGVFSLYEGYIKLQHEEDLRNPWVAVIVLLFGVSLEIFSLIGCLREINKIRGKKSLWVWFRTTRKAELMVVLGEDIAALVGLLLALSAVGLSMITGNPVYDALGSMAIGILLIVVAILIAREVKSMMLGESAEEEKRKAIENHIIKSGRVERIYSLITLHLGEDLLLSVKIHPKETKNIKKLIADINELEESLKKNFPEIKYLFVEPDFQD